MGIKFVAAICPSCGASIQVDESKQNCFCQYCGVQVLVQDAIQHIQGTVSIDRSGELDNYLIRARRLVSQGALDEAEEYFNRALDIDANCQEALDMIDQLSRRVVRDNLHIKRNKPRTVAESNNNAACVLIVDGQKIRLDSNGAINITLPIGMHEINIHRAAAKLKNPFQIIVNTKYDDYTVVYEEGFFSIKAECHFKQVR